MQFVRKHCTMKYLQTQKNNKNFAYNYAKHKAIFSDKNIIFEKGYLNMRPLVSETKMLSHKIQVADRYFKLAPIHASVIC